MNREAVELREVVKKLVPLLAGKNLRVTQIGSSAFVRTNADTGKPELINIPSIPDDATSEFILAIQGFVDHEVAHILFTQFDQLAALRKDDVVRDGKTVKELSRSKSGRAIVQRLANMQNIIEDTMIERLIIDLFPGSKSNLRNVREYFLDKITRPALLNSKSDEEAFQILMVPAARAWAGQKIFQEFMEEVDGWNNKYLDLLVKSLGQENIEKFENFTVTEETREMAYKMFDIIFPPEGDQNDDEDDDDGEGDSNDDSDESKDGEGKGKGKGKSGDQDQKPGNESSEKSDDDDQDKNEKSEEEDQGDGDDGAQSSGGQSASPDDQDGDDESGKGSIEQLGDDSDGDDGGKASISVQTDSHEFENKKPEKRPKSGGGGVGAGNVEGTVFDFSDDDDFEITDMSKGMQVVILNESLKSIQNSDYTVFSRELDKIEPLVVPENATDVDEWVVDLENTTRQMTGQMQKDVERMMASQSRTQRLPGKRSGQLHGPNLYRLFSGDNRVFCRKIEHRSKDTAVTLLIDNSGSMHGAKLQNAMTAAYALSATLERVGVKNEVIGFTTGSHYNDRYEETGDKTLDEAIKEDEKLSDTSSFSFSRYLPILMPVFKSFDERITSVVKRRIAYMSNAQKNLSQNVDGESLEYAALRLLKQPESRKVMIVLSDGQPAGARHDGPHLHLVVRNLMKMNIDLVGIGIDSTSVERYYPNHVVLRDISELPNHVMTEIKRILM